MLIGIDICNTIADVNSELEKVLGRNPNPSQYFHPALVNKKDFFERNLDIFSVASPIDHSIEMLNRLAKCNELVYITARPREAKAVTLEWFGRNGYPIGEIYFTRDKVALSRKLGVSLAIDDAPHELEAYIKAGIQVLTKKQPYNILYPNRFEWVELK